MQDTYIILALYVWTNETSMTLMSLCDPTIVIYFGPSTAASFIHSTFAVCWSFWDFMSQKCQQKTE